MIDNWFTNKCMTLVGANGRALAGEALELAELALQEVKAANHKVWTDRNGNFYHKERSLFASAHPVMDQNGNQVRICGRMRQNDRQRIPHMSSLRQSTKSDGPPGSDKWLLEKR